MAATSLTSLWPPWPVALEERASEGLSELGLMEPGRPVEGQVLEQQAPLELAVVPEAWGRRQEAQKTLAAREAREKMLAACLPASWGVAASKSERDPTLQSGPLAPRPGPPRLVVAFPWLVGMG